MRELYKLANRSKGHGAYDRTRYGRTRTSPTSFVTHHTQQISKAAVVNDSKAILKCIISRKRQPEPRMRLAVRGVPKGALRTHSA